MANGTADNGEACGCDKDCSGGFCADGFCCETRCDGVCQSCGLATSLGKCTMTPAGVKPSVASQCATQDKSTCGMDGTCDGAGKCRSHEAGTVCKEGSCDADAVIDRHICDGEGACKLGPSTVCAPFSCNRGANQCFAGCASDADCVSGRKCVDGSCGKKMNGAVCATGNECASTNCANIVGGKGVCCNQACDGTCRSCNLVGSEGSCAPIPAGQGHALCKKDAPASCGPTGVCDGFGTCALYPENTPCGAAVCASATSANMARSCDGLGYCGAPEVQQCGSYRCASGACSSKCMTNAECADGIACVNGSCGPKLDGQVCTANSQCLNANCVTDTVGGAGICCNTACTGACRSCNLASARGRCTMVAAGAADPRSTCVDQTAATCGNDGRCDGAGACRKYAVGTVCAAQSCTTDVYTGPSTCNASNQCIKPSAASCFPYHCNANMCFTACTTNAQCVTPNICGMNGMISSCGLKPAGATCSMGAECGSNFCAQGVCCNSACTAACRACNLAGTVGSCTAVASGAEPNGRCAIQAASTCGTTGQCAAGQCARHASGTRCLAAACPSASTRRPPSNCDGSGTCVTPAVANCAPGRCDTTTLACTNICTTVATTPPQCTAPAMCVGGNCGLLGRGGTCRATNECMAGLTCYLAEGSPGVCCNTACGGTCESCRLAGTVGTCTAVAGGVGDPDTATVCVAVANAASCGLNGRCAGNNTTANATGTARCQFYGVSTGCRNRSCVPGSATAPAMETAAASCNGAGACPAVATTSCGNYNKCTGPNVQCATSCMTNADCVSPVTCNTQTHRCGEKLGLGAVCGAGTDCTSANCVDGVCCNSACAGTCQSCTVAGSVGTCSNVPSMCNDRNPCNGVENTCSAAGACQAGTVPDLDDDNPCTVDSCDPVLGIRHVAGNAGAVCRMAAGLCDIAEMCTGTAAACPADLIRAAGYACHPSGGDCDPAEMCNGTTSVCPTDVKRAAGYACHPSLGGCDPVETCNGTADACPTDVKRASGYACHPSLGECDPAETCNGMSNLCPDNAFAPDTMSCGLAGTCNGTGTCVEPVVPPPPATAN